MMGSGLVTYLFFFVYTSKRNCCECFSGREHQEVDFVGIHEKICQLLIPLRTPMPFASSEQQRQHDKEQQIMRQVSYKL